MEKQIAQIIDDPKIHAKWLNTLSYLENAGAKKIAKYEHKTLVKEEVLKHAAEEFRHAYFLKRQIAKIQKPFEDYTLQNLLGSFKTLHYLDLLEVKICRQTKEHVYYLVTYAIEMRAQKLYPIYNQLLMKNRSKISLRPLLIEEEEHLNMMKRHLSDFNIDPSFAIEIEEEIFQKWLLTIS